MIQQMNVLPIQQSETFVLKNKEPVSVNKDFKSVMQTLAHNMNTKNIKSNSVNSTKAKNNTADVQTDFYVQSLLANGNYAISFFEQMPDFCDNAIDSIDPLTQQEGMLLQKFLGCKDYADGFGNMFVEEAIGQAAEQNSLTETEILQAAKILYDKSLSSISNTSNISNISNKIGLGENNANIASAFVKTDASEVLKKGIMITEFEDMNLTNSPELPIKQLKAEAGSFSGMLLKTDAQSMISSLKNEVQPFLFSSNNNTKGTDDFSFTERQGSFLTDNDSLADSVHTVSLADSYATTLENAQTMEKLSAVEKPVVNQLSYELEKGLSTGKKEFQIELYPIELGKVSVKMVSEGGILTVDIKALNPDTQNMLLANAGEIKAILQAAVNHNVRFSEAAANEQYAEQQYSDGAHHEKEAQEQKEAKHNANWVEDNEAEMTADDFLTLMQEIEAVDPVYSYVQ